MGTGIAVLTAARVATVLALFGVNVVAARLLDPDAVGSAAVGQTVGMIAALLANGGLNISSIYLLQQRPAERGRLLPALAALAIIACVAAVAVVALAVPVTASIVDGGSFPLFAAAAALGGAMIAFEFSGAVLLGLGRRTGFVLVELLRGIGSIVAVTLLLLAVRVDAAVVLGLAIGYGSGALAGVVFARGTPMRPRFDPAVSREAVGFGLRGQIGNVFQFLGVRLDLLLVPAFLDLRLAGIYFVAVRASDAVGQVATAAASLVFPQVASQADRRATSSTERVVRLTLLVVLVSAVVLGLLAEPLLAIAFGAAYVGGASALVISVVAMVPLSLGRILAADLKGRGRPGLVSVSAVLTVVLTVVLDVLLIPTLGIVGAAIASLVTYTATAVALFIAYRGVTGGTFAALLPGPGDLRNIGTFVRRRPAAQGPDR